MIGIFRSLSQALLTIKECYLDEWQGWYIPDKIIKRLGKYSSDGWFASKVVNRFDLVWTRYLNLSFWFYCLQGNSGITNLICRLRGHPCGSWYYNYGWEVSEPDYHCKNCNEEIW